MREFHIHKDYNAGREAFRNGLTIQDNPYRVAESASALSWEAGFTEEWYNTTFGENLEQGT